MEKSFTLFDFKIFISFSFNFYNIYFFLLKKTISVNTLKFGGIFNFLVEIMANETLTKLQMCAFFCSQINP